MSKQELQENLLALRGKVGADRLIVILVGVVVGLVDRRDTGLVMEWVNERVR